VRLDQVGEWAAENADRIIFLPHVISKCEKSPYDNPVPSYQSHELLAVTPVPGRSREQSTTRTFD